MLLKKDKATKAAPAAPVAHVEPVAHAAFIAPEVRPNTPAVEVAKLMAAREWANASK